MKKGLELLFFVLIVLLTVSFISAAVPQTLGVHGRLTDKSGNTLSGSYSMIFSIYNTTSGGATLYNSSQTVTVNSDGTYDVILNNVTLTFNQAYFLGIQVGTDSEMTPRLNLTSSPYSFYAQNISASGVVGDSNINISNSNITANYFLGNGSQLTGITASASPSGGTGAIQFNNGGVTGGNTSQFFINTTLGSNFGFAGIGTSSPDYALTINGSGNSGIHIINGTVGLQIGVNASGGGYTALTIFLNNQSGGYSALQSIQSSGSAFGNLILNPSGGRVGIGTTTPQNPLNVIGSANITGSIVVGSCTGCGNGTSPWGINGSNIFFTTGNVGIGTSNPGQPLTVVGPAGTLIFLQGNSSTTGTGLVISNVFGSNNQWRLDSSGTGTLDIRDDIAGAVRLSITNGTNGGNVGIGTTSPSAMLHVVRGVGSSGALILEGNDTTAGLPSIKFINNNGGANGTLGWSNSGFSFTGNNVGINTTSPSSLLHINASIGNSGTGTLRLTRSDATKENFMRFDTAGATPWLIGIDDSTSADSTGLQFGYNLSNPSMIITTGGNVGINTSIPARTLSILTTGDAIGLGIGPGANSSTVGKELLIGYYENGNYGIIQPSNKNVSYTNLALNPNGGSVGIGTTIPNALLAVNGNISQTKATSCGLSADSNGQIICTSDVNLKNVLGNSPYGLNAILNITPILFQYKNESYVHVGFSAQNVQKSIPEATPKQNDGYLGLDTNAITAALVNSVKEQQKTIEEQNQTIISLQNKIDSICKLNNLKC